MNIAYVSSEKYVKFAYTSILSLLENNKELDEIIIYFIDDNINDDTINKIIELVKKYNREIVFYKGYEIYGMIDTIPSVVSIHGTINMYASLFLSRIESIDRVLLIESDVIINGPISDFYNTELGECYLSGLFYSLPPKEHYYRKEYPWYINAGVLLFDLKKLREIDSEKRVLQYFIDSKYKETAENALYSLYIDRTLPMLPKYHLTNDMLMLNKHEREVITKLTDYYSDEEYEEARNSPIMIHFANSYFGRPWEKKCYHPYKAVFRKYYDQIPWGEKYIDIKKGVVFYIIKILYKCKLLFYAKKVFNIFGKTEGNNNEQ